MNFTYYGDQFEIYYTAAPDRGTVNVYVDDALLRTINQYSDTTSPMTSSGIAEISEGLHYVRLEHASGDVIDLDAIYVVPPSVGTYQDDDARINYTGNWTT